MSFGNFGSKPMNAQRAPKAPKAPGKKPFSSRTVIGVVCIVLALLITFGVAPLVNRFTDQKVDIVRLKADVQRGQIITADHLEIVNVGSYNLPNNVIKDGKAVVGNMPRQICTREIISLQVSSLPITRVQTMFCLDLAGRR